MLFRLLCLSFSYINNMKSCTDFLILHLRNGGDMVLFHEIVRGIDKCQFRVIFLHNMKLNEP